MEDSEQGYQGIKLADRSKLEKGHYASIGPAHYSESKFGCRVKNVVMCDDHATHKDFCQWNCQTFMPYARELIDTKTISQFERDYINAYHKVCLETLKPELGDD